MVVPLVNALGKRTFKSESLKDAAIQKAFYEGAERGNQDIVENITNILRSPLRNTLMDCMHLGTMANQIKSFGFYWSKLIKETWIRPKRNMRMRVSKVPSSH